MIRIAIVIGSTRPGRNAEQVADWAAAIGRRRDDAVVEIVDIADFGLPHLDEPTPAARSTEYRHAHTTAWSRTVASFDGFVFVVPEYNHSFPGALKNAIDYLFAEWNDKAAAFVGYGLHGGVRAIEQLRLVMAELKVADVRTQVALSLFTDFEDMSRLAPGPHQEPTAERMFGELVAWAGALRALRERDRAGALAA